MNAGWHERHPMPKNVSVEERFGWHMAHQNACGCKPIPARLLAALAAGPSRPAKNNKKRKP